eukprot:Pompholyxophrys_punicea_v1_NODE_28_length_5163_cov_5.731206.p11 type:complete len:122 gc:universal NODE_28_length_5163_cov_5.731206:2500-2865(+)
MRMMILCWTMRTLSQWQKILPMCKISNRLLRLGKIVCLLKLGRMLHWIFPICPRQKGAKWSGSGNSCSGVWKKVHWYPQCKVTTLNLQPISRQCVQRTRQSGWKPLKRSSRALVRERCGLQ